MTEINLGDCSRANKHFVKNRGCKKTALKKRYGKPKGYTVAFLLLYRLFLCKKESLIKPI